MSEAPEQPTPYFQYEGQLWDRQSAAKAVEDFDKDPEMVKAALSGDVAAQGIRAAFWAMSRGMSPPGGEQAPIDRGVAAKQAGAAAEADYERTIGAFTQHMRALTPEGRLQHARNIATAEDHRTAIVRKEQLLKDPQFRERLLERGDLNAKEEWINICRVAAAPVAPPDFDWQTGGQVNEQQT